MNSLKKIMIFTLISLVTTSAFANKITVNADQSKQYEINNWQIETQNDGMVFILGKYTQKLLVIHNNETIKNGNKADSVTVLCNASNEDVYRKHHVEPGAALTCTGNYQDVIYLYAEPDDFKNGAAGTYEFQPIK